MKKFNFKWLAGLLFLVCLAAFGAGVGDNFFRIGVSSGFDIELRMGPSVIKWDNTEGKLKFSNDGATFKAIGSGSGGSGGENYNNGFTIDNNANAEDGAVGWSNTGGTFAVTTVDPLEGEQSFNYTPSAQNDVVESALLDFDKDILKGRSCQAQIEYFGGDENLTLKVIDGNADVLGSIALPAHSISAPESIFFICPSDADIVGDANKGDLKLRIENTGASASPIIKFDRAYLGTLIGLSESALPDEFSALIAGSGTITQDNSGGVISGGSSCGVGCITVNFSGLTVAPICTATTDSSTSGGSVIGFRGITSLNIYTQIGGTLTDLPAYLKCSKAGADAKQSVQVYKSIPKVSENINFFSAYVASTGAVQAESVDWINGPCTNTANLITCPYNNLNLTTQMSCTVTSVGFNDATTLDAKIVAPSSSTTQVGFVVENGSATTSSDVMIVCHKNGADFKMPIVQPVIVGQVVNSYAESASKNVRVEMCKTNNGGTPSFGSNGCSTFIDSYTDNGAGDITMNWKSGIWKSGTIPVCTCTATNGVSERYTCQERGQGASFSTFLTEDQSSGANTDTNFNVICTGEK